MQFRGVAQNSGLRYGATKRKLYQHPPPANTDPAADVETHADRFPPGATIVRTCFKVGGVPVGLDAAAITSWCTEKVKQYGKFLERITAVDLGAQDKFPLLFYCARPSAKFNHHIRILRPTLTAPAALAADDHIATAIAEACRAPAELFQYGHELHLRERLHAPVAATSPAAGDGGGFGVASLRTIAPAAFLASTADTLPKPHIGP